MGVTNPPSMFDFYVRVRPSRVFNMKTEEKSTHQISGGKPTKLTMIRVNTCGLEVTVRKD